MRYRAMIVAAVLLAGAAAPLPMRVIAPLPLTPAGATPSPVLPEVSAWAFPEHRAVPPVGGWDNVTPNHVPGSTRGYTTAQLHDLQHAVDWFPERHPPMPPVVAAGHAPDVKACGFCHQPDGNGRPENASLAGLPVAYIERQVAAFADGSRRAAMPGWLPTAMMTATAHAASPAELHAAAVYYNGLHFSSSVRVVETPDVPRVEARSFILALVAGGGREPTGERIVETPVDFERFERRDPTSNYVAYVPPGSLARGSVITARAGCAGCHAGMMQQWGAGRSPSYIFRQLLAFKTGARHDAGAAPMAAVAAQLTPPDMIAAAAYWASLKP